MRKFIENCRDLKESQTKRNFVYRILFVILGLASTLWFLIRVIPKPSRAAYPCIQNTAPIMSAFIMYIISITGSMYILRLSKRLLIHRKYIAGFAMIFAAIVAYFVSHSIYPEQSKANTISTTEFEPNDPVGEPYGIDPGKVVWVYDQDATDENMNNVAGDYWWMDSNTDQAVVQKMLDDAVKEIANTSTVKDAWLELFKYHDEKLDRSSTGYSSGDKIFIKVNLVKSGSGSNLGSMDTSPQIMQALLDQLVEECGVDQDDITLGDPFKTFSDQYYDKLDAVFPDVTWLDNIGGNGRVRTTLTEDNVFFTSDGQLSGQIPQAYADAKYMINIACLKAHHAAGITLCTKNHQGSIFDGDGNRNSTIRNNMMTGYHYCFPDRNGPRSKGNYRHLTDYMGHKYLGGNTVLNIVDGFWPGGQNIGEEEPIKYQMEPFNDDYPNSLFVSQDKVALEAVLFDFITYEYSTYESDHGDLSDPEWSAVPDYLEQAADPALHAIDYDPEEDGSTLGSLGVFEHWNNASDKQYSRNLGKVKGILLKSIPEHLVDVVAVNSIKDQVGQPNKLELAVYPNPVIDQLNLRFTVIQPAEYKVAITNLQGKVVYSETVGFKAIGDHAISLPLGAKISKGNYLCSLSRVNEEGDSSVTSQIVVQ